MKRILQVFFISLLTVGVSSHPALALKDGQARQEIEELRNRLNEFESSIQVRQMGLTEQLQGLNEELASLGGRVDENYQNAKRIDQNLEIFRIETQESLSQLNRLQQERLQIVDGNIKVLAKRIEGLDTGLRTFGDNLQAMADFEKKQEEKIGRIQGQLQDSIKVVAEEVGRENQRLQQNIAANHREVVQVQNLLNEIHVRVSELAQVQAALKNYMSQTPPSGQAGQHQISKGETLSTIAGRYGVTVDEILRSNQIDNPNLIREGQILIIPGR
jgi:LysM repeat protein